MSPTAAPNVTSDLLAFLHGSPTPYHAVASGITRLKAAGFGALRLEDSWRDLKAGRYFVTQGDSALLAFVWPGAPAAKAGLGFRIVGAHTDSPNLRLKPKAEYVKEGYLQLGVEVYGGALLNSWLDRDLGLAGRVVLREAGSKGDGPLTTRLVHVPRPLLRVTQLAIHLDRDVNEKGLVLNRQEHLAPIAGLVGAPLPSSAAGAAPPPASPKVSSRILELCAVELGVDPAQVVSLDLMVADVAAPTLGGLEDEMVFSGRLDNLAMCHAGLTALAGAQVGGSPVVPLVVLFDHEEVGSESAYGAASPTLPAVLERLVLAAGGGREDYHRALAASLCVSADMAHALHPNYAERHEARHRPVLNGGPVIKVNAQQRYATCARTAALFQEICRAEDVPVQHYAHRTDLPCGSTIGPITATLLGIRTVDVGNPMLSMHSARELGGAKDPELMTRALGRFLVTADPFAKTA